MQQFDLVLKNEKVKQYKLFALLLIILNVFVFTVLAFTNSELRYRAVAVISLIAVLFIVQHFAKKNQRAFSAKGAAFLLIIAAFLSFRFWLPALVMVLLAVLYVISIRPFIVSVNAGSIIFPSFPKRIIQWGELNNIIIRDGVLTIDFKNNKLLQAYVSDGATIRLDEKEFNEFCSAQLKSATSPIT